MIMIHDTDIDIFLIPFVYSLFYTVSGIALYILLCVFLIFADSKSKLFGYLEKVFIILSLLFICISSYLFLKSQFVDIDEYDFWNWSSNFHKLV